MKKLAASLATPFYTALLALALPAAASAQSVALSGILGDKALLIIDGAAPTLLAAGSNKGAVKVLSVNPARQEVSIDIMGRQSLLRVGASPVSLGSTGDAADSGRFISIPMGSGGHFFIDGLINGGSAKFLVDTGASTITMGRADADRLGIDYKQHGTPITMGTANGVTQGQRVNLKTLRIGEVQVHDIDAVVGPNMPFILLGNNFLSRFKMQRNSDMMLLEKVR